MWVPRPSQPDVGPLLGREEMAREIDVLLDGYRIVSLLGPCGIGKTRIASSVAGERAGRLGLDVCFVNLEPCFDGGLVATTIALAIGAPIASTVPTLDTLLKTLKRRSALLVLHSCDGVARDVGLVVSRLLRDCANLAVLCTIREALDISGACVYNVLPLAIPAHEVRDAPAMCADEALRFASVALFVARATRVDPTFQLTDTSAPLVARICRRLDGNPLAIELAAPRVKIVSLSKLAQTVDERFEVPAVSENSRLAEVSDGSQAESLRAQLDVLRAQRETSPGERETLPAQGEALPGLRETVRRSIEWSYGQLAFDERFVLQRISIFADTWQVVDAIAVSSDERIGPADVAELLDRLVVRALVAVEHVEGEPRYHLHAAIRTFARTRLLDAGETYVCERRRAVRILDRARELETTWLQTSSARWERAMRRTIEDARAALAWALGGERDVALGLRLVGALRPFYCGMSPREGRGTVTLALTLATRGDAAPALRAPLWLLDANLANDRLEGKSAITSAERAEEAFRDCANPVGAALATCARARALRSLGRPHEALLASGGALATLRDAGFDRFTAVALAEVGYAHAALGDFEAARSAFEQERTLSQVWERDDALV